MSDVIAGPSPSGSASDSFPTFFSSSKGSILDRASLPPSSSISTNQRQVDGLVGGFIVHAGDWRSLASILSGAGAYRLGRLGFLELGSGKFLHIASMGVGLGAEVVAFELTNRSLLSATGRPQGAAPTNHFESNLWRWSGTGGMAQGLLTSLITFGTLKPAGRLASGENLLVQHLMQDTAMVAGHQVAGALGGPKPVGNLAEQFLHAEATTWQLGAGMALVYGAAPRMLGFERGVDVALRTSNVGANLVFARNGDHDGRTRQDPARLGHAANPSDLRSLMDSPLQPGLVAAGVGEIPASDFKPASPPTANILAMAIKKGDEGGKVIPFRRPENSPPPSDTKVTSEKKDEGPIKLVALGDIHAKWQKVQSIFDHEFPSGEGHILSVGDLVNYPVLPKGIEFFFGHGNHENFHVVETLHRNGDPSRANYHPIFAGDLISIGGLKVAALPGVFSKYHYLNPKEAPIAFWTPERVGAFGAHRNRVDVLLMHEAPEGVGFEKKGQDLGNPLLTSLIEFLNPRLVFFGHHHQRFEGRHGNTRIIGLDYPKRSYVVLEYDGPGGELRWHTVEAELTPNPKNPKLESFKFPWEVPGKDDKVGFEVIPMEREKRMEALLKEKHVEKVKDDLTAVILEEIKDSKVEDKPFAARIRASSSVNTVLPHVARYAAALEANPKMTLEKKQELIGKAYDEMTKGLMPQASPDLVRAFEGLLQALGIVKS